MQYNQIEIGTKFTFTCALDAPVMLKTRAGHYEDRQGKCYVIRSHFMNVYPLKRMAA